ncbi:MAG TPA: hypothetical protein VIZ58_09615 [Thermoanaerobaculia bacterium]
MAAMVVATACGNLSNEDVRFLAALPRASEMHVAVPASAASSALTSCTIGSAAEWKKAKDAGVGINAAIDGVLALIDRVRSVSPSRRETDLRVWGPFADGNHPGVSWQVSILRFPPPPGAKSAEAWLYSFEGFRAGVGWKTVLDGSFYGGQSRNGLGELTLHFDASAALGTNEPGDPTVPMTIHYDLSGDPRTVQLDVGQGGALGLDPFQYFYAGYATGSGRFEYAFTDAGGNHLVIRSGFTPSGSGQATISWRTSAGATASVSECWDDAACLSYVLDPALVTTYCSGMSSCGAAAACPAVP